MFDLFKDAWSYAKQLTIVSFIKDAIKGGKEVCIIIGEWFDSIFSWVFFLSPIGITWYFFGAEYLPFALIYMFFGSFPAIFNDSGPAWMSYVLYYFWLPILIGDVIFVEPTKWFLRKMGWMKPKYNPGQIMVSKHLAEQGRKIIERNKNKNKKNK